MRKKFTLFIMIVLLLVSGCSEKKEVLDSNEVNLKAAINTFIQDEISTGESLPLMQRLQNDILQEITYEIQSYSIENGTMMVEFTYVDVLDLSDSITDPELTEENYCRYCIESLSSKQCKMITEEIQVSFKPSADGFSVISSEPLANVLSGGVLYYYLELLEGIGYE